MTARVVLHAVLCILSAKHDLVTVQVKGAAR